MPGLADAESQLGIPLIVKDRLVGVLGVESTVPNAFDVLDEMLLSIVGSQIATGIDNARLHRSSIERSRELDAANAELLRLNETLEANVAARTAELTAALDQVRHEQELSWNLLRRMAPPEVIPLMLEDKLLPRRLDVTVVFTDLKGFTAYSAGQEPDEVFSQLNEFFSWAGEIIRRYRGYINKTNGDGIMARVRRALRERDRPHRRGPRGAGAAARDPVAVPLPNARRDQQRHRHRGHAGAGRQEPL